MQSGQHKRRLAPLKGAWEFQGLGADPKNPVAGQMRAIFEHVARLDGKPVPSVRLRDPHMVAYTQQEVMEHYKKPGLTPVPSRQLLAGIRAFEYLFPEAETILTIENEPPYQRPPLGITPFRRGM